MAQRAADIADHRAAYHAGADQQLPQLNHELLPFRGVHLNLPTQNQRLLAQYPRDIGP